MPSWSCSYVFCGALSTGTAIFGGLYERFEMHKLKSKHQRLRSQIDSAVCRLLNKEETSTTMFREFISVHGSIDSSGLNFYSCKLPNKIHNGGSFPPSNLLHQSTRGSLSRQTSMPSRSPKRQNAGFPFFSFISVHRR